MAWNFDKPIVQVLHAVKMSSIKSLAVCSSARSKDEAKFTMLIAVEDNDSNKVEVLRIGSVENHLRASSSICLLFPSF